MPKKLIKRWLPDHNTIKNHKNLQVFGDILHDANLWHLNRRSASKAFAIGLMVAFVPVPFQMMLAASIAIIFHANLPLSVALVWLSNPITIPPIFYACYKLGIMLMGIPAQEFTFELSWNWVVSSLSTVSGPFLLGSAAFGIFFSITGYLIINALWRWKVAQDWKNRKETRNS